MIMCCLFLPLVPLTAEYADQKKSPLAASGPNIAEFDLPRRRPLASGRCGT